MKIKTKKQFTLPQLIQWAIDNEIEHRVFVSNPNFDGVTYKLGFHKGGDLYFEEPLTPTLLFTVEIEEEITLTTPLPSMLHVWKTEVFGTEIREVENESIASQYTGCSTEFWLKEDNKMHLIWRNGGMVE